MSLITRVIADPPLLAQLNGPKWDELLRCARKLNLLGAIQAQLESQKPLGNVLPAVLEIISGFSVYTDYIQLQARRELKHLDRALTGSDYPVVLLKGAAYIQAQLPPSRGRRLSDIDLLVPKANLEETEQRLLQEGWAHEEELTAYDQHYYRDWSHEIPPLRHPSRGFEVDVHHNLTQPTGRIRLDPQPLLAAAVPVAGTRFSVLAPHDMLLHSATHLFMNDELRGGLRDLVDMHQLCLCFTERDEYFWTGLAARAEELDLTRPLYYALSSLERLLRTPIPADQMLRAQGFAPSFPVRWLMASLIDRVFDPDDVEQIDAPLARWLLFVRSHWIRMPPLMLMKHLGYKWLQKRRLRSSNQQYG